jgi:hypothetical protein
MGAKLFHADKNDETNGSFFFYFYEDAYKRICKLLNGWHWS